MITSWQDYECWKEAAEQYHSNDPNRLASFKILAERAYKYFRDNGFPDEPRTAPTKNFPNGKVRKFNEKEIQKQKEEMRNYDLRSKQVKTKRYGRK